MRLILIFVLLCSQALSRVTFDKAEVLEQTDLPGSVKKASFNCPTACKVYTPTSATSLKITDEMGTDVIVFNDLHNRAVDNPLELPAGNYFVAFINIGTPPQFYLYIVQRGADNYNTKVYTSPQKIDASNERFVTLLTDLPGFRVSGFAGDFSNAKVYATGFDSVGKCKPVFASRSFDNAERTSIPVWGPIGTVDFGSEKGTHIVNFGYDYLTKPSVEIGSSTVITSPGYVGCPNNQVFTNVILNKVDLGPYKINNDGGISLRLNSDYSIVSGTPSVNILINTESIKLTGTDTMDRSFEDKSFAVSINWNRAANDYLTHFAIQIDNLAKSASAFGISSVFIALFALMRLF